jgi:hypothetical protein
VASQERAAASRPHRVHDVVVQGDHRDEPATKDSDFLVFVAKKPSDWARTVVDDL